MPDSQNELRSGAAIAARYHSPRRRGRGLRRAEPAVGLTSVTGGGAAIRTEPVFGRLRGQIHVPDDFNETPEEIVAAMKPRD